MTTNLIPPIRNHLSSPRHSLAPPRGEGSRVRGGEPLTRLRNRNSTSPSQQLCPDLVRLSRRDTGIYLNEVMSPKPKVARNELPWEYHRKTNNPKVGCVGHSGNLTNSRREPSRRMSELAPRLSQMATNHKLDSTTHLAVGVYPQQTLKRQLSGQSLYPQEPLCNLLLLAEIRYLREFAPLAFPIF